MSESTISATSSGNAPTGLGIQAHVIYATNSARWWAFWMSAATTIASAYSPDGSTWTAGATHTTTETIGVSGTADGRGLSVAYANISSTDVVHFSLGESDSSGVAQGHYHLRATISGTTITYGSDTAGGTLNGSVFAPVAAEGGTTAITANHKLIDGCNFSDIASSSEDCEVGTWPNADAGTSWTAGTMTGTQVLSTAGAGASTWVGSLNSGDNTVFIGDNGNGNPGWTNLETDVWNGSAWGTVGTALASALGANADPNDWGAVVLDSTHVMVVWRNSTTNIQYRIASVSGTTLSWNTAAALPTSGLTQPASGTSGFALISDGTNNVWLFVIDSGAGNNVKYCKFNTAGAWTSGSWGTWTTQESTSATRTYIGISPQNDGSGSKNYLIYWTEGSSIKGELFATVTGSTPGSWVPSLWPPQAKLPTPATPAAPVRAPYVTATTPGFTFPVVSSPPGGTVNTHNVQATASLALVRTHGVQATASLALVRSHPINASASLALVRSHSVQAAASLALVRSHSVQASATLALIRSHPVAASASLAIPRSHGISAVATLLYKSTHGVQAAATLALVRSHAVAASASLALVRSHPIASTATLALVRSHPVQASATLALVRSHPVQAAATLALVRTHSITATASLALVRSHPVTARASLALVRTHGIQAAAVLQSSSTAVTHGIKASATLAMVRSHSVQSTASLALVRPHPISATASLALVQSHSVQASAALALVRSHSVQAQASLALVRSHSSRASATLAVARSHSAQASAALALAQSHGVSAAATLYFLRTHAAQAAASLALVRSHSAQASATLALVRSHAAAGRASLAIPRLHGVQAIATVQQTQLVPPRTELAYGVNGKAIAYRVNGQETATGDSSSGTATP